MSLEPAATPRQRASGAEWELGLGAIVDPALSTLGIIPGLRIDLDRGVAIGMVDAVAAAAQVLGAVSPAHYAPQAEPAASSNPMLTSARAYQQDGVARLLAISHKVGGVLLADDVGLGKTLQAILMGKSLNGPKMVVCPAFIRETWRDELTKWGESNIAILGPGTTKSAKAEWGKAESADWVVTSYELAKDALAAGFEKRFPVLAIFDEGHYLCGRKAYRSKIAEEIATVSRHKVVMTATPMWSRPRDFYRVLRILFGKRFGTPSEFDFRYCGGRLNEWGGMENKGSSNADELKLRLSYYMVRREKAEVLKELPPLTRQVIWVDAEASASALFERAMVVGGYDRARALQIALEATLAAKMGPAMEYAAQARQFLLFTWRKDHARAMAKRLVEEHNTPCHAITGDMSTEARQATVRLAESQKCGIVATIDSLGAGVNLQGVASFGIMHSLDWVPLKMIQAEGRLHRMGQVNPVTWVYVAMKGSMDQVVVSKVVAKLDQFRALVPAAEATSVRDDLGANVDGAGVEAAEQAALRLLYDSF